MPIESVSFLSLQSVNVVRVMKAGCRSRNQTRGAALKVATRLGRGSLESCNKIR